MQPHGRRSEDGASRDVPDGARLRFALALLLARCGRGGVLRTIMLAAVRTGRLCPRGNRPDVSALL
jgi:hypothetical protein